MLMGEGLGGWMNLAWTRSRPRASERSKPVMVAALRFHSLTWPAASTPKMGAFAVFMKDCSSRSRLRARTGQQSALLCGRPPLLLC